MIIYIRRPTQNQKQIFVGIAVHLHLHLHFPFSFFLFFSYSFLAGVKTVKYSNYLRFEFYASVHIRLNDFNSKERVNNISRLQLCHLC